MTVSITTTRASMLRHPVAPISQNVANLVRFFSPDRQNHHEIVVFRSPKSLDLQQYTGYSSSFGLPEKFPPDTLHFPSPSDRSVRSDQSDRSRHVCRESNEPERNRTNPNKTERAKPRLRSTPTTRSPATHGRSSSATPAIAHLPTARTRKFAPLPNTPTDGRSGAYPENSTIDEGLDT